MDTLSATDARAVSHGVFEVEDNGRAVSAVGETDNIVALLFAAGADTSSALDAGIEVDGDGRVREVGGQRRAMRQAIAFGDAELFGPAEKFGVAVQEGRTCIGHQHLQHQALRVSRPLAGAFDFHALLRLAATGGGQDPLAIDLHHAGAAVAVGAHVVFVAQMGNLHAMPPGGLEDGLAGVGGNGGAVEFEIDACLAHWLLPPGAISWGK